MFYLLVSIKNTDMVDPALKILIQLSWDSVYMWGGLKAPMWVLSYDPKQVENHCFKVLLRYQKG